MTEIRAVCLDWGGTLMAEDGPADTPMAQWPDVQRIEGAFELLSALSRRLPLHLATNATVSRRPQIVQALQRVGLDRHIEEIFCFTEIGHRKDTAAFWQAVSSRLGLPLPAIAMLGDDLQQDAVAPRALGVQAVWFNPHGLPQGRGGAVPAVTRLAEFVPWVLARVGDLPQRPA